MKLKGSLSARYIKSDCAFSGDSRSTIKRRYSVIRRGGLKAVYV
jgi:hypothetical protein